MSTHQIDSCTTARIQPAIAEDKQPWMRVVDLRAFESVLIEGKESIRNLRAACDAALGEGEVK